VGFGIAADRWGRKCKLKKAMGIGFGRGWANDWVCVPA
jgi:hypothetical protein